MNVVNLTNFLSLLTVILIGVLLPITFIIGGVTFYHYYKKKKFRFTARDGNEITPNGMISEAQLQTISNHLNDVILKHSMSLTAENSDELEDAILDHSFLSPTFHNCDTLEKPLDVFISYRRSNGSSLASLLATKLENRKFSVFLDVER